MRQASQSCRDFLCDLQNRLNEFMGRRGVNDHMLALGREAAQALNWGEFVKGQRQPTVDEYKAFFRLAALLRPVLEKTRWPDKLAFPHVEHTWPENKGTTVGVCSSINSCIAFGPRPEILVHNTSGCARNCGSSRVCIARGWTPP